MDNKSYEKFLNIQATVETNKQETDEKKKDWWETNTDNRKPQSYDRTHDGLDEQLESLTIPEGYIDYSGTYHHGTG